MTARLPSAALAARCTSMSEFSRRKRIGPRVSRSTARTSGANALLVANSASRSSSPSPCTCRQQRYARTSLGNLSKCKACTPLQVDVIGVDKGAQRPKGFARKEVGFGALRIGQSRRKQRLGLGMLTFSRYWSKSATASRSFSASTFSYKASRDLPKPISTLGSPTMRWREAHLRSTMSCRCPWPLTKNYDRPS